MLILLPPLLLLPFLPSFPLLHIGNECHKGNRGNICSYNNRGNLSNKGIMGNKSNMREEGSRGNRGNMYKKVKDVT